MVDGLSSSSSSSSDSEDAVECLGSKKPAAKPPPDPLVNFAVAVNANDSAGEDDDSTNDGAPLQRNQYTNPKNKRNKQHKRKAPPTGSLVPQQQDSDVEEIDVPAAAATALAAAKPAPKKVDPLLALLLSRKAFVGGVSQKGQADSGLQFQHLSNLVALGIDTLFHPSIAMKAATKAFFAKIKLRKSKKGSNGWTKPIVAEALFQFN